MAFVEFTDVMDSDADHVWSIVRKFGALDQWHPAIASSAIDGGGPDCVVGSIRRLVLADGATLTERLLALDDRNRSLTYEFVEAPLPLDNYVLTVTVTPLTRDGRSVIAWSARFNVRDQGEREHYEMLMFDLIATGSDSLKAFAAQRA